MAGFGPGTQLPPELETGPVFDTATPITQAIAGAGQPGFAPPPMAPPVAMAPPPAVNFASMTPEQIGAAAGASQAQQGYGSPPPVPAALPMPGGGPGAPPPLAAPVPGASPARTGGGGRPKGPDELTRLDRDLQAAGQKEQQAVTEGGQAVAQAKEAEAGILEHAAGQEQQFAAEQAAKAKEVRQRQELVDQQDAANLQKARDYVIPDFWQGKEGARVGSVLSVMGGAIAAGILGGPNGALQIINKQTDDYFHRQKQKIDNLYRYAEETGRLNAQIKLRYAQELVDLKDQHSAVLHSVATRLQAAALHTGSEEEKKNYLAAAAKIGTQVAEQRMKTPQERASIEAARASAAASYANAAESRAKAAALKDKATGQDEKMAVRDPGTGQVVGYAQTPRQVQQIGQQLNAGRVYIESLEALKKDLAKGHLLNPLSDEAKTRQQLFNDAVAKGRGARGLGVSNANLALEHGAFGGSGVGASRMITPQVIDNMIADARDKSQGTIRTLIPVRGAQPGAAPAQAGGGQQYPIGARATSGGKPIVMTANGWQLVSQ